MSEKHPDRTKEWHQQQEALKNPKVPPKPPPKKNTSEEKPDP